MLQISTSIYCLVGTEFNWYFREVKTKKLQESPKAPEKQKVY